MAALLVAGAALTVDSVQRKRAAKKSRRQHNEQRYAELQEETERWRQTSPTEASPKSPTFPPPVLGEQAVRKKTQAVGNTDDEWWNPTPENNRTNGDEEWWKEPVPPQQQQATQSAARMDEEWWKPAEGSRNHQEQQQSETRGEARSPRSPTKQVRMAKPPASPTDRRRKSVFGENTDVPTISSRKASVGSSAGGEGAAGMGMDGKPRKQSIGKRILNKMNKAGESMGQGGGASYHH